MDTKSYTEKVLGDFVAKYVCQSDKLLKKYLWEGDVKNFRKRLSKFKDADENIKKVVLTTMVNELETEILRNFTNVIKDTRKYGFLILSGGAAINKYVPFDKMGMVNDIDFKFVPVFKGVGPSNPKYFGYTQMAKILLWNEMGRMVRRMSSKKYISTKILKIVDKIRETNVGKCLGINIVESKPLFKRRYGYIRKLKQGNSSEVIPGDVLQDVELLAIDLSGMSVFLPSVNAVRNVNLGGLVDVAILRMGELGAKVIKNTTQGYKTFPNILVAGKKFIINDIYLLRKFKLRPEKMEKDRQRLVKFAQHTGDSRIKNTDSNTSIYKRARKQMWDYDRKLIQKNKVTNKNINMISDINVTKYSRYTTPLTSSKIQKVTNPIANTSAPFRFDVNKKKWVENRSNLHIRALSAKNINKPTLRGYNPKRNKWIPKKILKSAFEIPFVPKVKDKTK